MILKVTSRIARGGRLLFLPLFGGSYTLLPVRNSRTKLPAIVCLLFFSLIQSSNALQLSSDTTVATAGYYQLIWSGKSEVFLLQESTIPDFKSFNVIYEGNDLARVISGKPDGDYFYRLVDSKSSQISNTVKVEVIHHSLTHAILFFSAGALVFTSILFLVLKGIRLDS